MGKTRQDVNLVAKRPMRLLPEKQTPPVTRPETIRGMIDAMLHILSKDPGEKPIKKEKIR